MNTEASEKKSRSGTWLRIASAVPLIPGILWLMFLGPPWGMWMLVFGAIAVIAVLLSVMMRAPHVNGETTEPGRVGRAGSVVAGVVWEAPVAPAMSAQAAPLRCCH